MPEQHYARRSNIMLCNVEKVAFNRTYELQLTDENFKMDVQFNIKWAMSQILISTGIITII